MRAVFVVSIAAAVAAVLFRSQADAPADAPPTAAPQAASRSVPTPAPEPLLDDDDRDVAVTADPDAERDEREYIAYWSNTPEPIDPPDPTAEPDPDPESEPELEPETDAQVLDRLRARQQRAGRLIDSAVERVEADIAAAVSAGDAERAERLRVRLARYEALRSDPPYGWQGEFEPPRAEDDEREHDHDH